MEINMITKPSAQIEKMACFTDACLWGHDKQYMHEMGALVYYSSRP